MKRVEVNPGELFAVSDKVILVHEYESVVGMIGKIGTDVNDRIAYLLTFTGKVNNRDRHGDVTVAMSPADVNALIGDLLTGLEMLVRAQQEGGTS